MKDKIIEIKKRAEKQLKEWNYPNEHYIEAQGALMVCNELLEQQPDKENKEKYISGTRRICRKKKVNILFVAKVISGLIFMYGVIPGGHLII